MLKISMRFFFVVSFCNLFFTPQVFGNDISNLPNFSSLVESNSPSVVNISTTKKHINTISPFAGIPPEFLDFFGISSEDLMAMPKENLVQKQYALGSGFIIRKDGYIVTNAHVIRGADIIYVSLHNGIKKIKATLIGTDMRADIALLKIENNKDYDLQPVIFGDSKDVKVGEWVLAIGEPFGFDYTATKGIISAKKRKLSQDPYVTFIQTDVPINPGSSGGPLFNMDGEVIGMNSQIYSKSGGFMGVSFAIPSDTIKFATDQLIKKGFVQRGILGIEITDVDLKTAKLAGIKIPFGALIKKIKVNSASYIAGLQVGDIITFFDGNKVNQASDLLPMVGITPIGSNPSIVIKRNGKEVKGNIKITAQTKKKTKIKLGVYLPRVGFSVGELDKEELKLLGIKNGVKITAVRKSFAHLEGFVDGDILISFNFKKIHTVSGLIDNISIIPDRKRISVRVFRNNKTFFLSALVK